MCVCLEGPREVTGSISEAATFVFSLWFFYLGGYYCEFIKRVVVQSGSIERQSSGVSLVSFVLTVYQVSDWLTAWLLEYTSSLIG